MDKEKEIEDRHEIASIINTEMRNGYFTASQLARRITQAGYGNVEQAVKEFAEKLLKDFEEQRRFYETASIGHKDVSLASIDYCIRQIKRQLNELYSGGNR